MSDQQEPQRTVTAKKSFAYGLPLVLLAALPFVVLRFTNGEDPFRKVLEMTSREVNKTCPIMQDADTRLDGTEILPEKIFQYNYTLTDTYRDSIDVEMLYTGFLTAMTENARTNPGLELFRQNKVTLSYNFKDKAGQFVTRIKITPDHYK